MTRVILASASSGRLKVLRQAGIDPLVIVSDVDEDAVAGRLSPDAAPAEVTIALATAKATTVAHGLDSTLAADCVVIGCDSMLHHDGKLVGKPISADAARRQWKLMGGTVGELHTGHCVIRLRDGAVVHQASESACSTVVFGTQSDDELDAYVRSGEPLRVAGSFTLDGLGGWFIDAVHGDPSAVIGIGLPLTRRLLRDAGLSMVDLWVANPLQQASE
jgi:nucleoside triphosphate pyrophosphatase